MGNERTDGRASFLDVSRLARGARDMRQRALDGMLNSSADLDQQKREYDRLIRKGLRELSLSRHEIKKIMDFYEEHFNYL